MFNIFKLKKYLKNIEKKNKILIDMFKGDIFYLCTHDYSKIYFDYYKYENRKVLSKYKNQRTPAQMKNLYKWNL